MVEVHVILLGLYLIKYMKTNPKVAVIGCGYWGKNLVRNFYNKGALSIICDNSDSGLAMAKKIAPDAIRVRDIGVVLQSDVQAVVVATPAVTHYNVAKKCLRANKDVMVEKPLALTFKDGSKLVDIAKEQSKILMVGHVLEYHPAIRKLYELVRSGVLGDIRYAYSNRLNLGMIRREENALWSFAPHDIAIMLRLFGGVPIKVVACGKSYLNHGIEDVTITNLFYPNAQAHIYVSWLHPFKEQRLVIIGSKKMASFDDVAKKLIIYDQYVEVKDGEHIPIKNGGEEMSFSSDEPLGLECDAFLEAVRIRSNPLTDGVSGLQVLQVLEDAHNSLKQGNVC